MSEPGDIQRAILPIPDRRHVGLVTYDAKDPATRYPTIEPLRPPPGAPNALVVLIDDVGFGASSAFGGPCQTPRFERLANDGLRYDRFRTTALCAPARASMRPSRSSSRLTGGHRPRDRDPCRPRERRGGQRVHRPDHWVELKVGKDDHTHLLDPEEHIQVLMARR